MTSRKQLIWATTALAGVLSLAGTASAQSTGTEAAELNEIVVTGQRGPRTMDGVITAEQVGKSRSTITQEFISTQASGQSINEVLNLVPGMNFTNNDPYGSSGGNIRLHGFDSNRIAQTFDGMPLNDSGNYALYTNQQLDSDLVDKATVNTGTTDADSPTASATGGTINISSITPTTDFGGWVQGSIGDFNYQRFAMLLNTGEFGPFGTRAWFAYSDQSYDKFKGQGDLNKIQYNAKVYQPIRDNGDFVSVAFHWNRNRNNAYNGPYLIQSATDSRSDVEVSPYGWDVDFSNTYTAPTFVNGSADVDQNGSGASTYWGLRINPSDTGNIRGQSRFTLAKGLVFTFDPSFQYVLANGGSQNTRLSETATLLRGSQTSGGVDLNGDGDTLDSVRVMTPSNTHTQRYGINSSLLWSPSDNHSFRLAYTLDWARHRQTGMYGYVDFTDSSAPVYADIWGGLKEEDNRIVNLDGYALRSRDRLSYAQLNQVAVEYRGKFIDDHLRLSLGVRAPFFKREMNQNCYSAKGSSSVLCTTQTATISPNSTDNYTYYRFGTTTDYIAPYSREKTFDDILPNMNVTWRFDSAHSLYGSYAESLTLPRTDNLYTVIYNDDGDLVSPIVDPEKSKTFDIGYRYQSGTLIASASLWYTQFENRILSTYDEETGIYADRNVGDVDLKGFDAQLGFSPIEPLSIYLSASYNDSEIKDDVVYDSTTTYNTAGKTLVEVPDWTFGLRAQYETGPLQTGVQVKYVGERWVTDVNDLKVDAYTTVNADARFDLGYFGMTGTYVQLNVINLFNEDYYGSLGTVVTVTPTEPGYSASSRPYASQGAPRTIQASVRYAF
ncbi:MAG: TonB-dependent receptor [Caulobacterales bacterium RIFOXYB1_FULL_67_16]|nr:MAG: TonB-dependent receptor [Caulobacterales bacterium RIFOXYB1_FULL_67_16]